MTGVPSDKKIKIKRRKYGEPNDVVLRTGQPALVAGKAYMP